MNSGTPSASRLTMDQRMRSQLTDSLIGGGAGGGMSSLHQQFHQYSRRLEVVSRQATKVTAISTKLEWRIDQFEKLMKLFKNGHNLISRQFACPQAPTVVWELHVYPNGKREEDANHVSFFLRQVGLQRDDPIMTEFQIYTLDSTSCRISICRDTKDFSNQQGRGKFQVQRDKMLQALRADGSLLLICEVEYLPPGSKICVEQDDEADPMEEGLKGELSVRDSLRDMLDTELLADCTIQVGNKTMMAHRCILAQHSPVFRSMFSQKSMLEAQNGFIHITDSRPEPVRAMLDYIYTGQISYQLMEAFAQGILAIADKYAVIPLKEHCERYLASSISRKNVASMAIIADTYFAASLKRACTRFISQNHKAIIRSPEWKELKSQRGVLANELLESVLDEQAPNGDQSGGEGDNVMLLTSSSSSLSSANHALSSSIEVTTNAYPSSYSGVIAPHIGMGHGASGSSSMGSSGYHVRGNSRQEQHQLLAMNGQHMSSGSEMASTSSSLPAARHTRQSSPSSRSDQPSSQPARKRLRRGKDAPAP